MTLLPNRSTLLKWLVLGIGAFVVLDVATFLVAEGFWFEAVGYLPLFRLRWLTQGAIGLMVCGISAAFLLINLHVAQRHSWQRELHQADKGLAGSLVGKMGAGWLFFWTLSLSLGMVWLLVYHGQVMVQHWHPVFVPNTAAVPDRLRWAALGQVGQLFRAYPWGLGVVFGGLLGLLIYPQPVIRAIALLLSVGFGWVLSEHWTEILLFLHPTGFEQVDPVFQQNLGTYIFALPVWELLGFWLTGLAALGLISVSLLYLLAGNSLSQGQFPGFSVPQRRHLLGLAAGMMGAIAAGYWLDRYRLLYSLTGVDYGASYTDLTVILPVNTLLSLSSLAIALVLLQQAWAGRFADDPRSLVRSAAYLRPTAAIRTAPFPRVLLLLLIAYLLLVVGGGWLLPAVVQRAIVQPNELQLETPYLKRSIAATRQAFDLQDIDEETFDPQNDLTLETLQANELTVKNIRLWDIRPLLETNRQLQRIRPYYEFPNADIDRYTLQTNTGGLEQQQVLIAARELDYGSVPAEAQTWVNQHLIYTHGYGFTLSPVNTAGESGLPNYLISGIEHSVSEPRIRDSIPIGKPRIYYGELTNTYVMTQTRARELDYPSGSDNVYNTYDGEGGVAIGTLWQRLLFAKHLRDWRMLLAQDFTPDTHLLYRRNILKRVQAIAPFLHYDQDPYLVVANATPDSTADPAEGHYLYWILDAYTTSDRYPYSDPLNQPFNYIRNSVKIVIDAYHGRVEFYIADERDPIINSWNQIVPGMFKPLSAMPASLQVHIRYPQDLYRVQSDHLMVYHMTDPQVFYNREDQWRAPNEVYADESRLVEPYYLIMRLPNEEREEFILLRPYTPNQRTNLVAWLAARSDRTYQPAARGNRSGKMLLYRFPKQDLVYGPEQLEARINQDPVISQQISLWNRTGSRAIQGNLLVIPIEQSLLYVEPLYLEATLNRLPTLARVIVAYRDRITMGVTLDEALRALFQPAQAPDPIVRPLEADGISPE